MTALASVIRRPWTRLTIGGTRYDLADDVTQNESLDAMTAVAQLAVWQEPNPDTGLAVTLDAVDLAASTMVPQFAGILNRQSGMHAPDGTSLIYYATGPLWRLNRTPQTDHNLSGLTDGQAVQAVLDLCNVTFDPADIADAGYVLGAQSPILWRAGQAGWDIIRELDRVFAMATIEVGAGRVVRFAYDRAPSAALISRTFVNGQDATFWRAGRDRGDLSAIQNWHQVTGATWEGSDGCRYTPWAVAEGDNPKLPGSTRVAGPGFSSDIIQDEALAGAIAQRLMRWNNREPDTGLVETANDPNLGPGRIIGMQDETSAIGLSTPAPYLVLTADRRGDTVTLTVVGGAAGSVGTVTTGVRRECNQAISDFNLPGSFTIPAIGVPPLLASVLAIGTPPDVGAAPELPDVCVITPLERSWSCGTDDVGQAADWTVDTAFTDTGGGVAANASGGFDVGTNGAITYVYAADVSLNRLTTRTQLESWELIGSFTFRTNTSWVRLGAGDPAALNDDRYLLIADFLAAGNSAASAAFKLATPDTSDGGEGLPFATNEPISFRLTWDHATSTLACTACQAPFTPMTRAVQTFSAQTSPVSPFLWVSTDETGATAATVHALAASRDCGTPVDYSTVCTFDTCGGPFYDDNFSANLSNALWTTGSAFSDGSVTINQHLDFAGGAFAYHIANHIPFDQTWTLSGSLQFCGGPCSLSLGMVDWTGSNISGLSHGLMIDNSSHELSAIHNGASASVTLPDVPDHTALPFTITHTPGDSDTTHPLTVTVTVDGVDYTVTANRDFLNPNGNDWLYPSASVTRGLGLSTTVDSVRICAMTLALEGA